MYVQSTNAIIPNFPPIVDYLASHDENTKSNHNLDFTDGSNINVS